MTTAERLYTVEEFARLPEPIEGGKMELVDGRVVIRPANGRRKGRLLGPLSRSIAHFATSGESGEAMLGVGFRLFTDRVVVRAPDVAFVESSRLVDVAEDGFIDGAPTLAVEVISPDDRDVDIDEKVREYLAAGARRVWLVRPRTRTVAVHHPGGLARTYGVGDVLDSDAAGFEKPGFELRLAELFGA